MSGPGQSGIDTASSRKDAVRKAFNQEYMATQQAMSQAAERARTQVLDQRYTISSHAQDVKAGATAPQPPLGAQQGTQQGTQAAPAGSQQAKPQPQGAPYMGSSPAGGGAHQVMFDIANEIRNIINKEVDQRMQILAARVEAAILQSLPTETADNTEADQAKSTPKGAKRTAANKADTSKKTDPQDSTLSSAEDNPP
ncbi:hypothetical protein [Thalassospira lucentensis]|uniref:Uncharacterized protein n=1 Tax=Thalassospira lucentensis TaxID=168935 RepID=A0A358HTK1_9PROT|nr:hypothetical protein [Thalassospira lucentensis]HBU98292.1 hypothetical protein [Thalassospira lucentensis]HCW69644.1 hypothetical protein [Thalassospira lucentensis]